eukprot:12970613-Heterocapsa_arctica.AAC.1
MEDPSDQLLLEQEADFIPDEGTRTPEAPPEEPLLELEGPEPAPAVAPPRARLDFNDATAIVFEQ